MGYSKFSDVEPDLVFHRGYSRKDYEKDLLHADKLLVIVPDSEKDFVLSLWVRALNDTKLSDDSRAKAMADCLKLFITKERLAGMSKAAVKELFRACRTIIGLDALKRALKGAYFQYRRKVGFKE